MDNYIYYTVFDTDEAIRDIVRYCVNNPEMIDFSNSLDLSYNKVTDTHSLFAIKLAFKDCDRFEAFVTVARLLHLPDEED